VVLEGGTYARYSPTGHLVYARRGSLYAVTFDTKELEVTGQPVPVLPQLMTDFAIGAAEFDLSDAGSIVKAPGHSRTYDRRLVRVERDGQVEAIMEPPRPFADLSLSRDGRTLALQINGGINSIWLYEIARGTLTRLTSEWDNGTPVWDPTGGTIAFASPRATAWNLHVQPVEGARPAERLATSVYTQTASSWSPDGTVLAFYEDSSDTGADIWILSLPGDRKAKPFLNGRANEMCPAFAPDGRWIAYQSDETGEFEIYLRRFPDGGGMKRVSTGGGFYPVWNPNGKELFYRNGEKMMAVTVGLGEDVVPGRPTVLFESSFPADVAGFVVTPDGQRFIALDDSVAEPAPTHLVLVQNFREELKRLVPPPN
jgi:Tol biopolymer transport system component